MLMMSGVCVQELSGVSVSQWFGVVSNLREHISLGVVLTDCRCPVHQGYLLAAGQAPAVSPPLPHHPHSQQDDDQAEEEGDSGDDNHSRDDSHLSDKRSWMLSLLHS